MSYAVPSAVSSPIGTAPVFGLSCARVLCLPLFLCSLLGPHNHGAKLIGRWRCLGSQVYSHGLRVIMKGQPPQEWRAPGKKQIEKACANERQVVLALAGGEIIFFELDEAMQNIQASTAQPEALTRVTCRAILLFRRAW